MTTDRGPDLHRLAALQRCMRRVCRAADTARLTESQYQDLVNLERELERLLAGNEVDEAARLLRFARDFVCLQPGVDL